MKKAWLFSSIAFVALAVFSLYMSFQYPYKDRLGPGPGFFPFWLSLITGILSVLLVIQTARAKDEKFASESIRPKLEALLRIVYILGGLLAVLLFLNLLGFRIILFLFLLVVPIALGARSWWIVTVLAAIGSFGVFHVFYYWLKLPLPMGIFGI